MVVVMTATNKLVVVVTGDPPGQVRQEHGSYADMIRRAVGGSWPGEYFDVDPRALSPRRLAALAGSDDEPPEARPAAVVITGSAASVTTDEPWMARTAAWLRDVVDRGIPTFGICFGHQLLARALGGAVRPNPSGHEIGTRSIERCVQDPLLPGPASSFEANCFHADTVSTPPAGATVLARSAKDSHQCLRFTESCYGVQFHPEFDRRVMASLITARRSFVEAAGLPATELLDGARDTPEGRRVLQRFVETFAGQDSVVS
jgi:GMP synthase (glutamine-hydrolysing)